MTLLYPIGTSGQTVAMTDAALAHMARYRQLRWWQREAGGLLFAEIRGSVISVVEATGPHQSDRRWRFGFAAPMERQQALVHDRFDRGLSYVGEWHSHPQDKPEPSHRDMLTMASRVVESAHDLAGFLFAIIGRELLPDGLALLLHDGSTAHRLNATAVSGLSSPP